MTHNVVDNTGVRVMADQCSTCIFRPGNLMNLRVGRLREMIDEAQSAPDGAGSIVCHDTLDDEKQAVCRGFFDRYPTSMLQVADRLGFIVDHTRI